MLYTNTIDVKELTIFSQSGIPDDVRNGIGEINYYESILETSIKSTIVFTDTGWRNFNNSVSAVETDGSDIQFAEKVYLKLQDEEDNKISFNTDETCFRIIKKPYDIATTQQIVIPLYLSTNEFINNELVPFYVNKRYEGKISDTVKEILLTVLKTQKTLEIEETLNNLNIIGDQQGKGDYGKVFNAMVNLGPKAIPNILNARDNIAGFFFYETSDGYKFKSIDTILSQKAKKKLIYNNTTSLPPGFDGKILTTPTFSGDIDVIKNLKLGTYNSQRYTLDLFESRVRKNDVRSQDQIRAAVLAGKNLPKIPEEFNQPSRITNSLRDTGSHPPGQDVLTQLKKSKELNFEIEDILNQSMMRFNQVFAIQTSFTIFCDLALRAGDVIECHFPELSDKTTQVISDKRSGRYLIVNLRHYISPNGPAFTRLDVARDSYGRI